MKLCSDGLYQLLVEKYRWTGIKSRPISGSTKCCTFLGSYKSSFNLNTHNQSTRESKFSKCLWNGKSVG